MTWFEDLTGFKETSPDDVRNAFDFQGETLISRVNGRTVNCGDLKISSLNELRSFNIQKQISPKNITIREHVGNVQQLHRDPSNAGALFQVASQFNLLEMLSPDFTPEDGVGIYENDFTQGPTCAIAAGAGTIYRNYFVPLNGQIGQTEHNQIDCLHDLGVALGNQGNTLWKMQNGYALPTEDGLRKISRTLEKSTEEYCEELKGLLKIGIQQRTQVTLKGCEHHVTQAYCSALPVAYCKHHPNFWEPFARLVLEASYEATLCAGILNDREEQNNKVFLTLLGGGAFGNQLSWIIESMERAILQYSTFGLEIVIVNYGSSNAAVRKLIERIQT